MERDYASWTKYGGQGLGLSAMSCRCSRRRKTGKAGRQTNGAGVGRTGGISASPHDPHPTRTNLPRRGPARWAFEIHEDANGPNARGRGLHQHEHRGSDRHGAVSAARAFLEPKPWSRPTLTLARQHARHAGVDQGAIARMPWRSSAAMFSRNGRGAPRDHSSRQGAINTPKLLMCVRRWRPRRRSRSSASRVSRTSTALVLGLQDHILLSGVVFSLQGVAMPDRPADSNGV